MFSALYFRLKLYLHLDYHVNGAQPIEYEMLCQLGLRVKNMKLFSNSKWPEDDTPFLSTVVNINTAHV